MSVFKVTGSILDVSGDVAAYVMNETRYIRANSATLARLAFQRAFDGVAAHISMVGANHVASIGSASIYDIAADTLDRQRPGMYRQTGRAIARCVAIKHARAETGASKAMAKAGRRIAEAQRRAGMPVRVKA
jgi:hypothetical protein